ncbi:MAG: porin family protein [Muribaculaceae bacterium]|nr:porin family protein [Muribaculaceae bacterium]
MKKLQATIIAAAGMTLNMTAIERPQLELGATYNYSTEYKQSGVGVKLQAPVGRHFRVEPEIIYSNQHHDVTTLHLNLNVHYVMPMTQHMNVYPIAGVSYSHWGYVGPNANRWGANLGAGIEHSLGKKLSALAELRMQAVKQETQIITSIGVKYKF